MKVNYNIDIAVAEMAQLAAQQAANLTALRSFLVNDLSTVIKNVSEEYTVVSDKAARLSLERSRLIGNSSHTGK